MRSFFRYLFLVTGICFFIYSCIKKKTYSTIPVIEYKDFHQYPGDSADLQLKFTDGDGDIGVPVSGNLQTLFITYYYKDTLTQNYLPYHSSFLGGDTLVTGYVIRAPRDSYEGKPVNGEFSVRLQKFRHSVRIKQVKYVIYLNDNNGHKSQPITTPEINVLSE